ncbi:N-acetylmuramoyl-L-alanine amidase family protein [Bacillus sp. WLY-B-L8]|uniref:N-acetylmuramoyl-L-alanine amidase family protein n=1 Tax=Bacillus multifaciens TaxID=3068506 RepID=UPI002741A631|nr:cell wall-binding protein [Bacillus sp. WLY-B-L8]MDP7980311.1 cell wall-binding protein [Bacillus sp. WLY-B-L8]
MNEKYKKRIPKVLPVGIAMGILFSASPLAGPLTESKVKADVDTFGTIVTTFGGIYDAFLKEPFVKFLEETDAKYTYNRGVENSAYKAPTFQKGEFGISVFDFYKDQNFSKKVKLAYPDGKVEYKTIKHGQQLRIKQAGTIVDLTPDEPSLSKHDILYITQKQLDEGKTGVALANWQTFYLESSNKGHYTGLADKFVREEFPNAYTKGGVLDIRVNFKDLFNELPHEKRQLGTATSEPVGKEVLSNYVTNDSKAREDFSDRVVNVFADTKLTLETPIALPFIKLNSGESYQIIPYKKGSNKVFVKKGSQYLSGNEGNNLQYSDSIGDNELFELVQIENSGQGEFQFRLNNQNGVSLAGNMYLYEFGRDWSFKSELRFTAKTNNEIHNWLREWYPGKENEKQQYDGIQIVADEYERHKLLAKDSSGNMIKNSWVNISDVHYYAGSDGFLLKGWQEIEGKTYYFQNDYSLLNGHSWDTPIDNKFYNFDDNGVLQRSAWTSHSEGYSAYSDASGAFVEKGLREIDGKIYYFESRAGSTNRKVRLEDQNIILHFSGDKGALEKVSRLDGESIDDVTTASFEGKMLFFEKDGSPRKIGISKVYAPHPILVYYSLEEGGYYTGWKEIDGKKYHFHDGGMSNFDGHENIDGKRYYFNHEGHALLTGFVDINGSTFYMNDKGEKVSGFQNIDGKLYFFHTNNSEMAKNGLFSLSKNDSYAAGPDGVIYQNFKGYINNHDFGQRYIETNNEGLVTKK